jgi:ATP-dependent DNA helicase RecG
MAPTELLARQHHKTLTPWAEAAGLKVGLLTGGETAAARKKVLAGLKSGSIHLVIGTHALLEPTVQFKRLVFAVVDEQHRFGVEQRERFARGAHCLHLSATPIPRSLALTAYGDMDVSTLREKPAGRKRIQTWAASYRSMDDVIAAVQGELETGGQVFWVVPRIEASEEDGVISVDERAATLADIFGPGRVTIAHGDQPAKERAASMARFADGEVPILVATTVIEVGVDVPEATMMIAERPDRFGVAQLHQLRGRVGRGARESQCVLLHETKLGEHARRRVQALLESDDGFRLAELDAQIRGFGEILGAAQQGRNPWRVADPDHHQEWVPVAREIAERMLEEQHPGLPILSALFPRAGVDTLTS